MYDNETFQSQSFTNYKSKYSVGAAQHFQEQFLNFILKRTSLGIFCTTRPVPGLSLRAGGRGFSLATKRVAPGYFYRKIEEK